MSFKKRLQALQVESEEIKDLIYKNKYGLIVKMNFLV